MSVTTHLQLLTTCEQWGQGKAPTSTLLGDLLPLFREVVPAAHQVRLYLLDGHALKAEAASDAVEPEPLLASTIHSKALTLRKPFFDSVRGAIVVPLNAGNTPYGILEVVTPEGGPLTAEVNDWLLLLGGHTAQALEHRTLRQAADAPVSVTRPVADPAPSVPDRTRQALAGIAAAPTLAGMTAALTGHLLPTKSVLMYAFDETASWQVIHAQPGSLTAPDGLTWEALPEALRAALDSGELREFMVNADTSAATGDALARWLNRQGMASAALVPVRAGDRLRALLLVADRSVPCLTSAEAAALEALAGVIGARELAQESQARAGHLHALVDDLNAAARGVVAAGDNPAVAQAVARTLARDLLAAGLTLFTTPASGGQLPESRRLIGLATADAVKPVDSVTARAVNIPADVIDRLQTGEPVILDNLRGGDSYLSPQTQADYGQIGTRWLASFGLRSGSVLIGTLDLLNDRPRTFTPDEIAAYNALADQLGLLLGSRRQIDVQRVGGEAADRFIATSRRIALGADAGSVSASILDLLPAPVAAVMLLLFDDSLEGERGTLTLRTAAFAARDGRSAPDAADTLPNEQVTRLFTPEPLRIGDVRALADHGLPNTAALLAAQGLIAAASLPLRAGQRAVGLLLVTGRDSTALDDIDFGPLQAIGAQLAAAVDQRGQLDQTREALAFVATQYETSSALFQSDSLREMLSVLYRFVGGRYSKALLALVDDAARIARVVAQIDSASAEEPEMETQTLFTIAVPDRPAGGDTVLRDVDGRSLTLLLHRRDGHLAGLVQMVNGEPVALSTGDLRALRGLADQLAIILENRFLLQETDKVLSETRALYEMNKALVAARSSLDVLGAIRQTVGQRAHSLALAELGYSGDLQQLNAFDVYALLTPDHAEQVSVPLYSEERSEAFIRLMAHWDVLGDQVEMVPDLAAAEQRHPALTVFDSSGLRPRALVVIPVFEGDTLRQQLLFVYDAPQRFTERDRRLFAALKDQVRVVLENQRLLRDASVGSAELSNQVKLLEAVNAFVGQITVARNEIEMLNSAAEALVSAVGVDHVGISIMNPDGNSATVTGEYPDYGAVGSEIPADNPLMQHLLREQAPYFIDDIANEPLLAEDPRKAMIEMGVKSVVLYPLIDGRGRVLGTVGMDSYRPNNVFTQQMFDVVQTIAAQMIISLQNIRQLRATQRQAQQLQKLSELSQSIQPMMDTGVILQGVFDGIGAIFPADRIAVYATGADRDRPLLVLERASGEVVSHEQAQPLVLEGTTAAASAWTSRALVTVNDTREQPLNHSRDAALRSTLAAPLFARGVTVGLIEIGRADAYGFSDSDALIFRQLVNQISATIENAEAYTAIQRSARAKAFVNDISSQLQQQSEIADVINVTVTELGRALGARKARIRLGSGQNGDQPPGEK